MNDSNAQEHDFRIVIAAMSLLMLMCLGCSLLAGAVQALAPRPTVASESLIALCAWSRNGSVGLWWNANSAPARVFERAPHYNAVCALVPWSAALPENGLPNVGVTP